jgi:uncharacterized membrane protein
MIHAATVLTIVAMASVTYLTRISGYVLLRNRTVSPRLQTVLEAIPGCVLISVIAPVFAPTRPADFFALALTVAAAARLPMLPTVLIGVAATGILRALLA